MVSNILMAISITFLTWRITHQHDRIVIVPPNLSEKAHISWSAANRQYYESFGLYVATLIGNITPKNVEFVADSVSRFMSPRIYPNVRSQLIALAKDSFVSTSTNASYFSPRKVVFEEETSKVFVVGELVTVGFRSVSERKPVVYEMEIHIENGLPLITGFTSYEGSEPHTLKWQQSQHRTTEAQ